MSFFSCFNIYIYIRTRKKTFFQTCVLFSFQLLIGIGLLEAQQAMFSKLKKKERKGHSTMELDLPSPWSPIPRCSHHGIGPKFSSFRLALIQHSAHMCNKFQIFNTFYKFIIDLHKIIDLQYLLYMLLNFIKFIHIFFIYLNSIIAFYGDHQEVITINIFYLLF